MVKIEDFAKDIQQKLEDISYNLYGEEHPQFNITDDMQIYQNRSITKSGRRFTPGILRAVPGAVSPSTVWGVYTGQYQLELYGYRDEKRKVQEIFREFISTYNGVEYVPEAGYDIVADNKTAILTLSEFIIDELTFSDDGTDRDSFVAYVDIIVSIFIGGLSAKETSLTIDGISIPFDEIRYKQDKSLVPNIDYTDSTSQAPNTNSKLVYELLSFNIPLGVSTEVDNLILNRALTPTYNDVFRISWNLGIGTKVGDYVLRSAFIQYNQLNEAIGVLVAFENTNNVVEIKIDGESIPALRFNFTAYRETETFNTVDDLKNVEVEHSNINYTFGVGLTILFDETNPVIMRLQEELLTRTKDVSHILTIEGVEETHNLNVIMKEGSWEFSEKANQTMAFTFVGEKQL